MSGTSLYPTLLHLASAVYLLFCFWWCVPCACLYKSLTGGGALSPVRKDLGGNFDKWFPICVRFFFFFNSKWRSALVYQIHFLNQNQSTMALWAEMTVDEHFRMSCMWAHFPDRFPHYAWTAKSAHSNCGGSRVYACLGVTLHLLFR